MHIAFDTLSENPDSPSSAINFFVAFAETLKKVSAGERWSVLVSRANRRYFEAAAAPGVDLVECPVSNERLLRRILVQQTWLPRKLADLRVDVILGYNVVPLVSRCARVVKISTLHHYETPRELARNPFRLYYRRVMFKAACTRAEAVVANSEHTRDSMLRYMRLPPGKIHIVPEAVSDDFKPVTDAAELRRELAVRGLTPGYVLFASTIWRYKNLHTLVAAMARLGDTLAHLPLVVAGKNGDTPYYQEVQGLIDRLGLRQRVVFLGEVPNDALVPVFQGASVFVNPSRSETYGKPVVEAMRCGVPVVAANAASLPQIAAGAARLVDPDDAEAMAAEIRLLMTDAAARAACVTAGLRRGRDFSWDATVTGTRDVCEKALRIRRRAA
jgi:glycosyltransferase involved in cell wall biosynthesis